jgi:predicted helicase
MRRAVAFWSKIAESERFAQQFEQVAESYFDQLEAGPDGDEITPLTVPTRHVDGTTKISSRRTDIRWLKDTPADGQCRVLTNAKCLTEGVDVPALDAVMFLTPRRSCPSPSPPGSTLRPPSTRTLTTTPYGRCSKRCAPTTSASTPTSIASP